MAAPKKTSTTTVEPTTEPQEAPVEVIAELTPVQKVDKAFELLGEALKAYYIYTDKPGDALSVHESMIRYTDGNIVLGWAQMIEHLEGYLGKPIRQT